MTRRDILRAEVKRLKNDLNVNINLGKLDSIKECREAIDKIYEAKCKVLKIKQNANYLSDLYIIERMKRIEKENQELENRVKILSNALEETSKKKGLFSFFR